MIKNNENEFLHLIEKLLTEKSFLSNSFLMKMKKTQKVSFSHSLNEMGICLDGELSQIYPLIDDDYEVLSIPVLDVFICSNDLKKELVKKMEVNLESIESKFVFDSSKNVLTIDNESFYLRRELDWEANPRKATIVYAGLSKDGRTTYWGKKVNL